MEGGVRGEEEMGSLASGGQKVKGLNLLIML
jgi:hypothetical protein